MSEVKIGKRKIDGFWVLDVEGKACGHAGLALRRLIIGTLAEIPITDGEFKILLNVSKLSKLDSSGLCDLIYSCGAAVRNIGSRMALAGYGRGLRNLTIIAKLAGAFRLYENEEKAIASF